MKKYCVIGEKLSHTMSPQIHNEFFKIMNIEATYDVVEIAMSDIDLPKTKELLKHLRKEYNAQVEDNIFIAANNVNLDKLMGYVKNGESIFYLKNYDKK